LPVLFRGALEACYYNALTEIDDVLKIGYHEHLQDI